jgi:hypothetical protein
MISDFRIVFSDWFFGNISAPGSLTLPVFWNIAGKNRLATSFVSKFALPVIGVSLRRNFRLWAPKILSAKWSA